ncbi:MAG: hypothetical protein HKN95_02455 [Acidimicrobiia bacterium]|nr:hypothetical protein [Acidimicrobiia bacterium]
MAGSRGWIMVAALTTVTACTSGTSSTATTLEIADAPPPTTSTSPGAPVTSPDTSSTTLPQVVATEFAGRELISDAGSHFSAAGSCSNCHTNMTDATGSDISIDSTWRSTMMANAARDPYWQATVRAEIEKAPDLRDVIEDKCSTCHMPMARTTGAFSGEGGAVLDAGYLDSTNELHGLAMDGVSCTVCHQIQEGNLGSEESFSGGFSIDADLPQGQRIVYGPIGASEQGAQIMTNVSGFAPIQSPHLQESTVCATCHTLYTPYVDANGEVLGLFPEQTTFLELQASAVNSSCQDCHMPEADGEAFVSNFASEPRSNVSRHHFVGGNDYMMSIMSVFGEELGLTASSDHVAATRDRIQTQLARDSMSLDLGELSWDGEMVTATAVVGNPTGHKVPTGFPSRRVWLHATLTAGDGSIVFESGAWQANGSIAGNDNDHDPAGFEQHHDVITDPEQVQIYEAIMANSDGAVTTTLLRGSEYAKDNRLLPQSFDKTSVSPDIGVYGAALADDGFTGGADSVTYVIDTSGFTGPFTFGVEVLYQSIGFRWAANLRDARGAEVERFMGYYDAVPNIPVVMATQTVEY